jgi:hypothetical protein
LYGLRYWLLEETERFARRMEQSLYFLAQFDIASACLVEECGSAVIEFERGIKQVFDTEPTIGSRRRCHSFSPRRNLV